ncbi:MAG: addiction module antidote protein family [Phycisphaerales bacterium]|jgi:antitoxin ParD1/3/4|nr:addiction module antidote protein family [Phycisphaerales bacterium]MDB5354671.1 addiction module antidote protein family [Phycisphaerales bacterium]
MQLSLAPELEQFVADKVASGRYAAPAEVVSAALSLLKEQEELEAAELEELRKEIAVGLEQIERGEVGPWDVEEIKAEGRKLLAAAKRKAV